MEQNEDNTKLHGIMHLSGASQILNPKLPKLLTYIHTNLGRAHSPRPKRIP